MTIFKHEELREYWNKYISIRLRSGIENEFKELFIKNFNDMKSFPKDEKDTFIGEVSRKTEKIIVKRFEKIALSQISDVRFLETNIFLDDFFDLCREELEDSIDFSYTLEPIFTDCIEDLKEEFIKKGLINSEGDLKI